MDKQGKEKLLREVEYGAVGCGTRMSRRFRLVDVLQPLMSIVTVVACIVACCCVVYCYSVRKEMLKLQESLVSYNVDRPTTEATSAAHKLMNFVPGIDDDTEFLDDEYDETNEDDYEHETDNYDEEEVETYDEQYNIKKNETSYQSVEGSADIPTVREDDAEKTQPRVRRAAGKAKEDRCKKGCKGKKEERRKCRKQCQGGKKSDLPEIQMKLPAAHFEGWSDKDIQQKVGDVYDQYRPTDGVPLRIFHPASWVDDTSPVEFSKSVAIAKWPGIGLVYAQAYIGGAEPIKSIIIVHKRDGREKAAFSCNNGVNVDSSSSQWQTCFVQGLVNLEKGDTIEVQRSPTTQDVERDVDKTFFGIVQLSTVPAETDTNRKAKETN